MLLPKELLNMTLSFDGIIIQSLSRISIDKAIDSIFWIDLETDKFIYVNEAAAKKLGYTREEMLQLRVADIDLGIKNNTLHLDHLKGNPTLSGQPDVFESNHLTKEGRIIPVELTGNRIDIEGHIYVCTIARDISDRKKREKETDNYTKSLEIDADSRAKELLLLNKQLKDEIEEKGQYEKILKQMLAKETYLHETLESQINQRIEFTRALVHELKTPLTPIVGASGILCENLTEEPWVSLARNIYRGAKGLNSRISDLLDLARLETNQFTIEKKPVQLVKVIHEIVKTFEPEAQANKQFFRFEVDDELPVIEIDEKRISQAITNLLDNAFKFTPQGETVLLKAFVNENKIVVEVEDSGCGLNSEEIDRLFEPYFRGESERNRFSGLGLGLALAKRVVDLHNGNIWARNKKDHGCIFSIALPIRDME
jgi:PAS domain S-box-containing protein